MKPNRGVRRCRRCDQPLHPAAAAGGFDTHPGCDLTREPVEPLATVIQLPIDIEGRTDQ